MAVIRAVWAAVANLDDQDDPAGVADRSARADYRSGRVRELPASRQSRVNRQNRAIRYNRQERYYPVDRFDWTGA